MIVYQVLSDGHFGGEVFADEHPTRTGVYLLPAGCVKEAPPSKSGHRPVWNGVKWTLVSLPADPEPLPEPSAAAKQNIAHERASFLLLLADSTIAGAVTNGAVIPNEWVNYRTALVAILDQSESDPNVIQWPEVPPPIEAPVSSIRPIAATNARIVLLRRGLLDDVEALIAKYPREVQIWFSHAQNWERGNPYIAGLSLELGLSDEDIDALFTEAAIL